MTIASEISRLQTDKECIRQAIISRGVNVPASVSLDDYAACIALLPGLPKYIDFLLIGGGGGGGGTEHGQNAGGGGGGGGFIECTNYLICSGQYSIEVGCGGNGGVALTRGCNGGNTVFDTIIAYGGGGGGSAGQMTGANGGSGGGGGANATNNTQYLKGGCGCAGQGCNGKNAARYAGGGGGGAGEDGYATTDNYIGGKGGCGKCSSISGDTCWYSGGGGGGSCCARTHGTGGCGGGGSCSDGTYYGGGGGGGQYNNNSNGRGFKGYQGLFIARYPTACGYNITGGCKYICGDYTIHCFTSDGTLTVG